MSVQVFGVPGSPYVRSVLIALEEKQAPYRLHALGLGEHRSEEHLARQDAHPAKHAAETAALFEFDLAIANGDQVALDARAVAQIESVGLQADG